MFIKLSKYFFDRTFLHSGARGDIVFSLPTIRALGGGVLFIEPTGIYCVGGKAITKQEIQCFKEVFEKCDYIKTVEPYVKSPINYDLNLFRLQPNLFTTHLVTSHAKAQGINVDIDLPWLDRNKYKKKFINRIIINHTLRYPGLIQNWRDLRDFEKYITFIGYEEEYINFIKITNLKINFHKVGSYLEIVEILNGCYLFIGNQSLIYTFAEALKIPRILSLCPFAPTNVSIRDNKYHPVYNSSLVLTKQLISQLLGR